MVPSNVFGFAVVCVVTLPWTVANFLGFSFAGLGAISVKATYNGSRTLPQPSHRWGGTLYASYVPVGAAIFSGFLSCLCCDLDQRQPIRLVGALAQVPSRSGWGSTLYASRRYTPVDRRNILEFSVVAFAHSSPGSSADIAS